MNQQRDWRRVLRDRRALRRAMCGRKKPMGQGAARRAAAGARADGVRVSAYLCIFCHQWHIGRPPNMRSVQRIARVIREMGQEE